MSAEPQINWEYSIRTHQLKQENFDAADAYVVGMAFIAEFNQRKKNLSI